MSRRATTQHNNACTYIEARGAHICYALGPAASTLTRRGASSILRGWSAGRCIAFGEFEEAAIISLRMLVGTGAGMVSERKVLRYRFGVPVRGVLKMYDIVVRGTGFIEDNRNELILLYIASILDVLLGGFIEELKEDNSISSAH